jgi:pimeloyl-ACP methyl ester carboxylesterase
VVARSDYGAVLRPDWSHEIVRERHPRDGSSVYTVEPSLVGDPSAGPIVLLHGVGNSGKIYGPVLGAVAEYGPVVAPTLHPSLLDRVSADRDDVVDDVVDWLAELHEPPWRLVGHSMGGVITGLILRSRPEVVAQAVLLNSPLPGTVRRIRRGDTLDRTGRALLVLKGLSQATRFGQPRLPRFLRGPELLLVRQALRGFTYDPSALDARVISRAIMSSRTTDGIDFLRLARHIPEWESEPFVDRPVEIILGSDDPLVPVSDFDHVAEAYPEAGIYVAPQCGHFAHLEHPVLTLHTIGDFFRRAAAA